MMTAGGARFRHVVFKGRGRGRKHAVNLAPRAASARATIDTSAYWSAVPRLSAEEERFTRALLARGGLELDAYRQETLRRRLPACLRALQAATADEAARRLDGASDAVVSLAVNAMVIGVTGFFRDATVFHYLRDSVIGVRSRNGAWMRVWSAGCSDGQELYSVAMLLAEADLLDGSYLLGTDCRAAALERARDGRYDARTLRDVSRQRQQRHFVPAGGEFYRVRDEMRGAVQWRRGDVTRVCEPGAFDLILCRNLAMYLTPDVAGALWQQLESSLRPGGYLVLGKAERPLGATRVSAVAPCVYRRGSN
jgi:chemotaxis methyl-accepting protein methylase